MSIEDRLAAVEDKVSYLEGAVGVAFIPVKHPVGDACPPRPPPDPEWKAWSKLPLPAELNEAYQRSRAEHGLGNDPDPKSTEARFWWLGRQSKERW